MTPPTDWQDAQATLLGTLVAKPRLGLVTDIDGTISPIVPDPPSAQVTPRNKELLAALREHLTLVAVISGRAAEDIHARVGLPGLVYVGNHGLERRVAGRVEVMPEAQAYRPAIEAALAALAARPTPGMLVEDKGVTISVHFRQVADKDAFVPEYRPLVEGIAAEQGLKLFQGRMVFELRPPIQVDKGSALRSLVAEYRLEAAMYLGDDVTDIDAFQAARQLRQEGTCYALAVGVESEGVPDAVRHASDLLVSGVSGTEALLAWLLRARSASST
jgi:trehalose 6-phosphate phosphatase